METTYAYLAGIIDADGEIQIRRSVRIDKRKVGTESIQYIPEITVFRYDNAIPDFFQSIFPARRREFAPRNSTTRPMYWWEADRLRAIEPLRCLLPHLRIKRRQAELTLMMLELLNRKGAPTAEDWAARQRLYEEVAQLNGPRPSRKYFKHRARKPGSN